MLRWCRCQGALRAASRAAIDESTTQIPRLQKSGYKLRLQNALRGARVAARAARGFHCHRDDRSRSDCRDYCRAVCGTSEGISLEAARRASATARPARDGRVERACDLTFWAVRTLPNLVRSANPLRRTPAVR